nr:reverse transcriptase domain-containing protein [Tanacetum cinerariifolium]
DDPPEVPMADNRTMAQFLQAPTVGYEDTIFSGHDKEDPHAHIRYFNKITFTMRVPNVPNSTIKLMLFPFLLEGAAQIWLEKEPPRSILTLVSKFINQFFPPSRTTNLRNEITRIQQRFDESFSEAWDRFNDLFRACPHHGFSELHQLDTFYNALNVNDQDSLNSAAGGNFLDKMPSDCLKIIDSKSNIRQSRAKVVVAKVNSSSSTPAISFDVAELKDMVRALLLDKKNQSSAPAPSPTPAPVKAVEQNCVTCSGTLHGNTITNPKEDLKGITTRSGVAYQGPTILIPSKVVKQGTEVTKDQVQTPSSQSTTPVQPPVAQSETLVFEPVVAPVSAPMPNLKPSIPYPSRRDNERRRDQANEQIEKFYEIFKDMSFEISFTDALILIPKFASTLKALTRNKEKLSEMARMSIGELTLRIGNEAITYNLDQTSRYSANYYQMAANKIDVTDEACEEYSQEVLGFSDVTTSDSPTPSGCQGEIAPVGSAPQEFDFDVLDTKGAENLAANHLSRLENPYENILDPKEINETFPLETLSTVTFRGDSSSPWFADFANYHAAKALLTNDARVVCKFLISLFARFGAPRAIISDRGTYFCNDQFAKVMRKYGVTHRLSTACHPQISGQVEISNHGLKRILERTIEVPMADNRTMAELLQAPTEGYEDAIVIPEIAANTF